MFNMKNIRPINHGRLIISGAGSFHIQSHSSHNTFLPKYFSPTILFYHNTFHTVFSLTPPTITTFLQGMDETTLKIIGWQGDMFKGTNVSKVPKLFHF